MRSSYRSHLQVVSHRIEHSDNRSKSPRTRARSENSDSRQSSVGKQSLPIAPGGPNARLSQNWNRASCTKTQVPTHMNGIFWPIDTILNSPPTPEAPLRITPSTNEVGSINISIEHYTSSVRRRSHTVTPEQIHPERRSQIASHERALSHNIWLFRSNRFPNLSSPCYTYYLTGLDDTISPYRPRCCVVS